MHLSISRLLAFENNIGERRRPIMQSGSARLEIDGRLASQIGMWDSNKGLMLNRFDHHLNATFVHDGNRSLVITTIQVSHL